MQIQLQNISIRDLFEGFVDNEENGVYAYHGQLNIRPPYQREFVYDNAKQQAVIDTVSKGYPLNVMYWAAKGDGTYEMIDGQQRTLSICAFVSNNLFCKIFDYDEPLKFLNLTDDQQRRILDYELTVYLCDGTDSERLAWFQTINIAGEELYPQELRNAVYSGPWTTDAKRYFSRHGCPAYGIASNYLSGTPIRQDYLQTAIQWISRGQINAYMAEHQHDANATALWLHFQNVVGWVKATFKVTRPPMKGVNWGELYDEFGQQVWDADALEEEIDRLMIDDDVTNKKGIYPYVLGRKEKYLAIRAFSTQQKQAAYERQKGICPLCGQHFELREMEGDHITPWCEGGRTNTENLQMLCRDCNRRKSKK